jgi:hypothetical protein
VVPNPYTLLSKISPQTSFFSVLDLKDTFFLIPFHPTSQPLFHIDGSHYSPHLTANLDSHPPEIQRLFPHTRFWLSPTAESQFPQSFPKQAHLVADLLLCSPSTYLCETYTIILFNSLAHWGYLVSRNKAQLISTSVSFMRLLLTLGYCQIPQNKNNRHTPNSFSQDKKGHSFFSRINWVF